MRPRLAALALAPALLAAGPAAARPDDDLAEWLAGADPAALDPSALESWRERAPDLAARLRRLGDHVREDVRTGAVAALGRLPLAAAERAAVVDALARRAGADPAERVRDAALRALAAQAPERLGRELLAALRAGSGPVRRQALARLDLLRRAPAARDAFVRRAFGAQVPVEVRLDAAWRLGEVGVRVPERVRTLERERERLDPAQARRLDCVLAGALLRMGDAVAERVPPLVAIALSEDLALAGRALAALADAPPHLVAPELEPGITSGAPARRIGCVQVATALELRRLAPALEAVAADRNAPWVVRQVAVEALGRVGRARSGEVLAEVLRRDEAEPEAAAIRREAARALARLPATPAVGAALRDALGRDDERVVRAALGSLLVHAASDARLARGAAEAVRALREDLAVPALLGLLDHGDPGARAAAVAALRARTKESYSFDPAGPASDRAAARARWAAWWRSRERSR